MDHAPMLRSLLSADPDRLRVLRLVHALGLSDGWTAAGFVRAAVWDFLHGRPPLRSDADVDVIWFDRAAADSATDAAIEARLRDMDPSIPWSVKNQARMHVRNGDAPYVSAIDAMRYWPETATAVAVRLTEAEEVEIAAPFGLDDLFNLIVAPTPRFRQHGQEVFQARVREKNWLSAWPLTRCDVGDM